MKLVDFAPLEECPRRPYAKPLALNAAYDSTLLVISEQFIPLRYARNFVIPDEIPGCYSPGIAGVDCTLSFALE
jgi:hypothetical protein